MQQCLLVVRDPDLVLIVDPKVDDHLHGRVDDEVCEAHWRRQRAFLFEQEVVSKVAENSALSLGAEVGDVNYSPDRDDCIVEDLEAQMAPIQPRIPLHTVVERGHFVIFDRPLDEDPE